MDVTFTEATNPWLDNLVGLAHAYRGEHTGESLLLAVPPPALTPSAQTEPRETAQEAAPANLSALEPGHMNCGTFADESRGTLIAVDANVVPLGWLPTGGVVCAIRAAALCVPLHSAVASPMGVVYRYSTGALMFDQQNISVLGHYVGSRLGDEDMLVSLSPSPPHYLTKASVHLTPDAMPDRIRSFVERLVLEDAVALLAASDGGHLVLDGSLGYGIFDTPSAYLNSFLAACQRKNINVIAVSKTSRMSVSGVPITALFHALPGFVGYQAILGLLEDERQSLRAAGDYEGKVVEWSQHALTAADAMYAVKFAVYPDAAYRVDVHPALGHLPDDVLDAFYHHCPITCGYPAPLVHAHQFSGFLLPDVQSLIAQATIQFGVRPSMPPTLETLYQPFGSARYK